MPTLTSKPKQVVKRLLGGLPDRAREVLIARYGLGTNTERQTLEEIGNRYGITRERVRQIENYGLAAIRKSPQFKAEQPAFEELSARLGTLGGLVTEEEFLAGITTDASLRNHIHFLLVLGEAFKKQKESNVCYECWFIDDEHAQKVQDALRKLYTELSDEDLIPEGDMIEKFLGYVGDLNEQYRNEEIVKRWLGLSKQLGRNPLGEWGKATSPNVRAKGMRDYAYLVVKRHGSPMHFREVAEAISNIFDRKAHVATTHNELIKDPRFVLVGRGLYALAEWGYTQGVVKDVIRDILKREGPLTREEIIDKVKKERYVKDNTILVNLQDSRYFKRNTDGTFVAA